MNKTFIELTEKRSCRLPVASMGPFPDYYETEELNKILIDVNEIIMVKEKASHTLIILNTNNIDKEFHLVEVKESFKEVNTKIYDLLKCKTKIS